MHKQASKILTVNLEVNPIGVHSSRPLMTISRDSGRAGENWDTDVWNDAVLLPFFRIEPNTSVKLDFVFNSSREYQSSVATSSLDILKRATALIIPNSALITPQNIDRFNEASTFVDTTINGLLKVSIDEKLHVETLSLDPAQPIASLVLFEPGANDPYTSVKWREQPVGQWTIVAERYEGSIFAASSGTADGPSVPAVASVLNFQVADNKTVRETLAGDSSVTDARDAVLVATKETAGDLSRKLCRAVASKADTLGFSPKDVNWVVVAYLQDMALPTDIGGRARAGCGFAPSFNLMLAQSQ